MPEICYKEAAAPQSSGTVQDAQPAKLLIAWVTQLTEEVQGAHFGRLRQLRSRLQSDAFTWDNALLTRAVEVFLATSRSLEFQSLRNCGVWARLTGATKVVAFVFAKKYDDVVGAAGTARKEFEVLSRDYRAHTSSTRKLIVELDMEYRALDREIDQGAQGLVELSYAIEKTGEPRALSSRAKALSAELKRFRLASALAKEITILGQNVLERRAALLERMKLDLHGFDKVWLQRVASILTKPGDRRFPVPGLDKAREVHGELINRLELTSDACTALQMEEQAMARRLAMLRDCLERPSEHG
jgi:hypothetical protein